MAESRVHTDHHEGDIEYSVLPINIHINNSSCKVKPVNDPYVYLQSLDEAVRTEDSKDTLDDKENEDDKKQKSACAKLVNYLKMPINETPKEKVMSSHNSSYMQEIVSPFRQQKESPVRETIEKYDWKLSPPKGKEKTKAEE